MQRIGPVFDASRVRTSTHRFEGLGHNKAEATSFFFPGSGYTD